LFLVLAFFCFKALDDPIEVLDCNSELYLFIARDNLTDLIRDHLHLEKTFSAHETLDFVIDFIQKFIINFVPPRHRRRCCLNVFDSEVLSLQGGKLLAIWPVPAWNHHP
jgi:hypothetical protein